MYLTRPFDYVWSFALVVLILVTVIFSHGLNLPEFMTWSWFSLFSGNSDDVGNVMTKPLTSGSIPLILLFWIILSLSLPYLAKMEEQIFRSNILTLKGRIIYSIYFGFAHMIMGVNITVSLALSLVGFIYSMFYVNAYSKEFKLNPNKADYVATLVSSSIHTKYNFILVTLLALSSILLCILK
jgi:hypothetical protein